MKKRTILILGIGMLLALGFFYVKKVNLNPNLTVGQKIDSLNGVFVYYNGGVGNVDGRQLTSDGYNLGLKYQCVEFVKRYYYEELNHKMPDSYGHAKDFFKSAVNDGERNIQRDLLQFKNPSTTRPKIHDLVVYAPTLLNRYGHVAIVSKVTEKEIEIYTTESRSFWEIERKLQLDTKRRHVED